MSTLKDFSDMTISVGSMVLIYLKFNSSSYFPDTMFWEGWAKNAFCETCNFLMLTLGKVVVVQETNTFTLFAELRK